MPIHTSDTCVGNWFESLYVDGIGSGAFNTGSVVFNSTSVTNGNHQIGTTDEIIQWAACKWGLPDNFLRAEAYTESTWFQYDTYPSGRCVTYYGCGDFFPGATAASTTYCQGIAAYGHDYQLDYGAGLCPKTFSIIGEMSWWDPAWGFNWAGSRPLWPRPRACPAIASSRPT